MKILDFDNDKLISIDFLRRNFGRIKNDLARSSFILTDRGVPIARLTATREIKRALMKTTAGSFKESMLSSDALWGMVLKRKSRKKDIKL